MLRAKPPKKKQPEKQPKISTSFIMSVIMPCVMLACKDQFEIETQEELDEWEKQIYNDENIISTMKYITFNPDMEEAKNLRIVDITDYRPNDPVYRLPNTK